MTKRMFGAAAVLAALVVQAAAAQTVTVTNVWARATTPGVKTAGIYMTLTSPAADKLTGATTPNAASATVHETVKDGTIMKMRAVAGGLPLPAGKPVTLAPGGYHLMLEGLTAPLKAGETVPVHLTFQNAPAVDVEAHVQALSAAAPKAGAMASMPGM